MEKPTFFIEKRIQKTKMKGGERNSKHRRGKNLASHLRNRLSTIEGVQEKGKWLKVVRDNEKFGSF